MGRCQGRRTNQRLRNSLAFPVALRAKTFSRTNGLEFKLTEIEQAIAGHCGALVNVPMTRSCDRVPRWGRGCRGRRLGGTYRQPHETAVNNKQSTDLFYEAFASGQLLRTVASVELLAAGSESKRARGRRKQTGARRIETPSFMRSGRMERSRPELRTN